MVPRRLTRGAAVLTAILAVAACSAIAVVPAQANNTRVSIANFKWSNENPQIDLGESVTWDWLGPDTQHSVSGQPPNATQWDSDPGNVPSHPLGDSFTIRFDQPGNYVFQCKLHTSVRGTVSVSDKPGNPNSDPGPQAPLNLDYTPPVFEGIYLTKATLGPKGNGTGLKFAISEKSSISADYYKLVKKRRGKKKWRTVRSFKGYGEWSSHIGFNTRKFASRTKDFLARPGKYVALVNATDESYNSTPSTEVRFEIKGKKKNKKRAHKKRRHKKHGHNRR